MEKYVSGLDQFLTDNEEAVEHCDPNTGICVIKTKDGLIEKKLIEKKLVLEDGRQLLTEERPITNSTKKFLR